MLRRLLAILPSTARRMNSAAYEAMLLEEEGGRGEEALAEIKADLEMMDASQESP